ncbi:MAG: hypothetical protein QOJ63_3072 [Solirubrobacteraceae bacterium]|jgi:hypothetical protein|nr:hypothetical protein [Solirubrobacteraceae bacterium]
MSTLMKKLTELANSPQGKRLTDKAQQFANDPKTKEQVEKAKLKLAELRTGSAKRGAGDAKPPEPPAGGPGSGSSGPSSGPHAA